VKTYAWAIWKGGRFVRGKDHHRNEVWTISWDSRRARSALIARKGVCVVDYCGENRAHRAIVTFGRTRQTPRVQFLRWVLIARHPCRIESRLKSDWPICIIVDFTVLPFQVALRLYPFRFPLPILSSTRVCIARGKTCNDERNLSRLFEPFKDETQGRSTKFEGESRIRARLWQWHNRAAQMRLIRQLTLRRNPRICFPNLS